MTPDCTDQPPEQLLEGIAQFNRGAALGDFGCVEGRCHAGSH